MLARIRDTLPSLSLDCAGLQQVNGWSRPVEPEQQAYRINIRRKKWYWALYTWFLNVQMVQAWYLFRATMRIRHQQQQDTVESEVEFVERMKGSPAIEVIQQRRERREKETKARKQRKEEKKLEEMPLLNFVREVVKVMMDRHSDVEKTSRQGSLPPGCL